MMRSRQVLLCSHCILNQDSVLEGWARAKGAFPIAEYIFKNGVGIIQLPCPEILFNGINRPPLNQKDYDTPEYRELCRSLLEPYLKQLKEYLGNNYDLLGIIAVQNSPTCSISGTRGILMEELFTACEREKIHLNYVEIPETYTEQNKDINLETDLKNLLKGTGK